MSIPSVIRPWGLDDQTEDLSFRSRHDILWDSLGPEHASAVHDALITADKVRKSSGYTGQGADPGRTYLEDFARQLTS